MYSTVGVPFDAFYRGEWPPTFGRRQPPIRHLAVGCADAWFARDAAWWQDDAGATPRSGGWDDAPPSTPSTVTRGIVLRCIRCATVRHDHTAVDGALERRSYDYPEGYRVKGEKLQKNELRKLYIRHLRRIRKHLAEQEEDGQDES